MLKCFTGKKNRERMAPGKMKDYTGGLIQTLRQVYNGGFYHRLVVQFYVSHVQKGGFKFYVCQTQ